MNSVIPASYNLPCNREVAVKVAIVEGSKVIIIHVAAIIAEYVVASEQLDEIENKAEELDYLIEHIDILGLAIQMPLSSHVVHGINLNVEYYEALLEEIVEYSHLEHVDMAVRKYRRHMLRALRSLYLRVISDEATLQYYLN